MRIAEYGSGDEVTLLLHGTPSTAACFGPLIAALSLRQRVLVPELPGYGATPPLEGTYTFPRVQSLLEAELQSRSIARVAVVGFSGGAYRAVALAFSSEVQVRGVVSIAGFAGLDPASCDGFRAMAQSIRKDGTEGFRAGWLARMASPGFANRHPAEASEILAWLTCTSPATLASELDAVAVAEDFRPRLKEVSVPILAMTGSLDAAVPPAWSADLARGASRGSLRLFPGAGHALLYEAPTDAVGAIDTFLTGLGA